MTGPALLTDGPAAQLLAPAAPAHSVSIHGHRYPVVLPKLRDPRLHVAFVTISIHVIGQVGLQFQLSVPQILTSILTCALIELVITFRRTRTVVWPASAMLTGSGIALILRIPSTPPGDHWTFHAWWAYAGVAAFAMLTKYLVRHQGTPVFNPSNVALVVTFVVFGSSLVEPLDFWWAPLTGWMILAYAIIIIGGSLVTHRLRLLTGALTFWVTLAAGTALVAAFGHCMTARWAFAPVCDFEYWRAIVTSPEVLIFLFFMITDPKTVPRGRVSHVVFCFLVAVCSLLLMAPQSTEYWTKVGLLAGLTVMCVLRPLLVRVLPEAGADDDHLGTFLRRLVDGRLVDGRQGVAGTGRRIAHMIAIAAVVLALGGGVVAAGIPARGVPPLDTTEILGRVPHEVDPSTMPSITIDQGVLDWNHEISGAGAQQIVLTMVDNLELESQALLRRDEAILHVVDHGDRLDDLLYRLAVAESSGTTVIHRYQIATVHVTLLVPFGKQDGLSLGMDSTGTDITEIYDATGRLQQRTSAPFRTVFVVRRATGARWLNVAERAPEATG